MREFSKLLSIDGWQGGAILDEAVFELKLIGPFRLHAPDGARIAITGKKAQALIAMLAVSDSGERTRSWIQSQLWGSRAADQARASLRNELSTLRSLLNSDGQKLIDSDKNRVWIDLRRIRIDVLGPVGSGHDIFLEGLDLSDEEGFEEWLRLERARMASRAVLLDATPLPQAPSVMASLPAEFSALPALAVLPFANLTGDPEQGYLAEGLSEDLIDRLARLRWLPIIARASSFTYRDPESDPRAVGVALGARYLLEGRLRKQGDGLLLHATLILSATGQIIWSGKLPLPFGVGSSDRMIDELLTHLAAILGAKIDQEEQMSALRKADSDLNVRELIWRGRWHLNRMTKADAAAARACFASALALEPTSPEAIIQNVWARVWELWTRRGSEDEIRDLRQMAQKAIVADCDDARGHMLAGIAEIWLHQPLRAEAMLRHAIELNPSLAMAHAQLGASLRVHDEHVAAIEAFRIAIRLSPNDHDMFFFASELAASLLMTGSYSEALAEADHAIARRGGYWFAHVVKVNALVRLDRLDEARLAHGELLKLRRDFKRDFLQWSPFADPRNLAFLEEGLNRAAE